MEPLEIQMRLVFQPPMFTLCSVLGSVLKFFLSQSCLHPNVFSEREPEHQRADDHLAAGAEGWNVGQHSIANRHLPGTN